MLKVNIPSSKGDREYAVTIRDGQGAACTCPGFTYRGKCRHLAAVTETALVAAPAPEPRKIDIAAEVAAYHAAHGYDTCEETGKQMTVWTEEQHGRWCSVCWYGRRPDPCIPERVELTLF